MQSVEEWAEIRRLHLSEGISIRSIATRLQIRRVPRGVSIGRMLPSARYSLRNSGCRTIALRLTRWRSGSVLELDAFFGS